MVSYLTKEEEIFTNHMIARLTTVDKRKSPILTDFLDPRQLELLKGAARKFLNVTLHIDGGYEGAERQRVCISPDWEEDGVFELSVLEIKSSIPLSHADYLGAILGTGIKREKIGDLHVHNDCCHVIVDDKIAKYLLQYMTKVGTGCVNVSKIEKEALNVSSSKSQPMTAIVSSMRIDTVCSEVCHLSRAKMSICIKQGKCQINFKIEESPSKLLKVGDLISIRGWGRFKVKELVNTTKKGNLVLQIEIIGKSSRGN